jgi:hypothetical protein
LFPPQRGLRLAKAAGWQDLGAVPTYSDVALHKYDTFDSQFFSKNVAGAFGKLAMAGLVSSHGAGSVYVTGQASVSIEGKPVTEKKDGFVAKFEELGERARVWMTGIESIDEAKK